MNKIIKCSCGQRFNLNQDSNKKRRLSCKNCKASYSLVKFFDKYIIKDIVYDSLFNSIVEDYKENYKYVLGLALSDDIIGETCTTNKRPHSLEGEENMNKLVKLFDSNSPSDILQNVTVNTIPTIENLDLEERPVLFHNPGKENLRYNYSFKSNKNLKKEDFESLYFYGLHFDSTVDFMGFISRTSKKTMIKTCLLLGDNLVEVQIRKFEAQSFLYAVSRLPEFEFITPSLDRVVRELSKSGSVYGELRKKEIALGYHTLKDRYLLQILN